MSKIKARDLVAGWPRGRSTSSPYFGMEPWWLCYMYLPVTSLSRYEAASNYVIEQKRTVAYHEAQQKMFDDFRRNGGVRLIRECQRLPAFSESSLGRYLQGMRQEIYDSLPPWDRRGCFL